MLQDITEADHEGNVLGGLQLVNWFLHSAIRQYLIPITFSRTAMRSSVHSQNLYASNHNSYFRYRSIEQLLRTTTRKCNVVTESVAYSTSEMKRLKSNWRKLYGNTRSNRFRRLHNFNKTTRHILCWHFFKLIWLEYELIELVKSS